MATGEPPSTRDARRPAPRPATRAPWWRRATDLLRAIYEPIMSLLAVALVLSYIVPFAFPLDPLAAGYVNDLSVVTWVIFILDYVARLYLAHDRPAFVVANVLDIVALLPLGVFAGAIGWFRVVRGLIMLLRYSDFFHGVFFRHGFAYIFTATFGVVLTGAYIMTQVEPGLGNFDDAIWWAIVTATTVGYGDISPHTSAGRFVAGVLMLVGIGFIGLFTASVASFFMERMTSVRPRRGPLYEQAEGLKVHLDKLEDLTPEEFEEFQEALRGVYEAHRRIKSRGHRGHSDGLPPEP